MEREREGEKGREREGEGGERKTKFTAHWSEQICKSMYIRSLKARTRLLLFFHQPSQLKPTSFYCYISYKH